MQKCKQCEWEFPDDMQACPYCGHPVESQDKKQKRRFNLRQRPDLPEVVKQPLPGLRPSQPPFTAPSQKHILPAIIVTALIVALVATSTLVAFAILRTPDQSLTVNPSILDFGLVKVGSKPISPVVITKSSGFHLKWQITPANVQWLQVVSRPKASQSSNLKEVYDVTANAGKLAVGSHRAYLQFSSSEGGKTQQVTVKIQVVKNSTPAKLNVTPLSLDFGSLIVGEQKTQRLTASNSGGEELLWTADKGKARWLTLDPDHGKIAAGARINVTVNTAATLTAGQYSTTIKFSSSGGTVSVTVKLNVTAPQIGSTVTPTPTPTPTTTQRQISSKQTQLQTGAATGSGQTNATNAQGTLTFYNLRTDYSFIVPAGTIWTGSDGIQVVNDAPVCLDSGGGFTVGYTVPAHTLQTGTAANIASGDVNMIWGVSPYASTSPCSSTSTAQRSALYTLNIPLSGTQKVYNNEAFTGGQDPQPYTFVQQSDIDGIATSLEGSTQQAARNDIHQQLMPNEHLVGDPKCTSNVFSDHNANDIANQVTVTVTTICTATAST